MRFVSLSAVMCCAGLSACGAEPQAILEADNVARTVQLPLVQAAAPVTAQSHPRFCLGTKNGSLTNGTRVVLTDCATGSGMPWAFTDGSAHTGSVCLDVVNGGTSNGTQLQVWQCAQNNLNQRFDFAKQAITWQGKTKCLDVSRGQFQNNTPIQLWDCDPTNENQQWATLGTSETNEPSLPPLSSPITSSTADPACHAQGRRIIAVRDADGLKAALRSAQPGDIIQLADGTYTGSFTATQSGQAGAPIALCGSPLAVLTGTNQTDNYTFYLNGGAYWVLSGFSVTQGGKGVMLDGASNNRLVGLNVHHVGAEGIHLRKHSSNNVVQSCTVSDTGLGSNTFFGEGIYVGSAQSNWCKLTDGKADRSDNNVISGCVICNTTAENIDIKEGTQGGTVQGNTLDGRTILLSAATSNINVKGNHYAILNNTITHAPQDALSVPVVLDGWGACNRFANNRAQDSVSAFGIHVAAGKPLPKVQIAADNIFTQAGAGATNVKDAASTDVSDCPEAAASVRCP